RSPTHSTAEPIAPRRWRRRPTAAVELPDGAPPLPGELPEKELGRTAPAVQSSVEPARSAFRSGSVDLPFDVPRRQFGPVPPDRPQPTEPAAADGAPNDRPEDLEVLASPSPGVEPGAPPLSVANLPSRRARSGIAETSQAAAAAPIP